MMNVLVMTPTKTQLYVTAGGGFFRESLNGVSTTNFGTNIGGGVKFSLFGPVQAARGLPDLQPPRRPVWKHGRSASTPGSTCSF